MVEPPSKLKLKPRKYQLEAFNWAYSRERAVVVLPTGTGKTLVAVMWAVKLLEEGRARQVLFLEPTRFLVEQIASYIGAVAGVEAHPVHGAVPRRERERRWAGRIVVATPEIVVADSEHVLRRNFDAIVVDECHHTTGKDAYVKAIKLLSGKARFRLGLSAYIPPSRRESIERDIGPIREWSWTDPSVAPYIPPWIGEVYEAQLNEAERRIVEALEELSARASGGLRTAIRNAVRWLVRDGALALRDSLQRPTMLAEALRQIRSLIEDRRVRPSHKMEPLLRILSDHEGFSKSIVFIDRVVVAEYACKRLEGEGYPCVLIRGRMGREKLAEALAKARSSETRIIVSTSAGEEGIDLPDADLLVMWSITASPLRFIQRHGRVLRATEHARRRLRFVAYIVTLDTVDVDSFVDAIETAKRIGVDIPIDESTVEKLWRRTTRSRIVAVLEGNPMPLEVLAEATGIPRERLVRDLRKLLQHGDIVYIYTPLGKIYAYHADIELLREKYQEYLEPDETITGKAKYKPASSASWSRAVSGTYNQLLHRLARKLEDVGAFERLLVTLTVPVSGVLRLVNITYTFLIDTVEKLELALRNAFSIPKSMREEWLSKIRETLD